jgi:predicted AAA+ superfamily ATPase
MTIEQWRKKEIDLAFRGLDSNRIVILRGLRGSGKSTALGEIARILSESREESSVVSIDLEDPRLAPRPRKETLELFSRAVTDSRQSRKTWILLDEAEKVTGWLAWARDFKRKTGAGVIAAVSGQPDNLMVEAPDIVEIPFFPFGLRQWAEIFTDKTVDIANAREVLPRFLQMGGLPACWDSKDGARSLVRLFHEILFHEVLTKSEVRDIGALTAIAVYLTSSTAASFSLSHMKGILTRSLDQARAFLSPIQQRGLVPTVSRT